MPTEIDPYMILSIGQWTGGSHNPLTKPKPMTDDGTKTCGLCGSQENVTYKIPVQGINSAGVSATTPICKPCFISAGGRVYYCLTCEAPWSGSPYKTDPHLYWSPDGYSMTVVPCQKHSHYKTKPAYKCRACACVVELHLAYVTWRGWVYCQDCRYKTIGCAADYCGNRVMPGKPGATKKGGDYYCTDCADAPLTPPGMGMTKYHPLSWSYHPSCGCVACGYLRSACPSRWPADAPDSVVGSCNQCHNDCYPSTLMGFDNKIYCHTCTHCRFKACKKCGIMQPQGVFHGVAGTTTYNGMCDGCIAATGSHYFCDVLCQCWWKNGIDCQCGAIRPYNYKTDPNFLTHRSYSNSPHTPFLGVELEVELLPGGNRKKGARIIHRLLGNRGWVMHDGSLAGTSNSQGPGTGGEYGFEIVTHPFTFEWFQENWQWFEDIFSTLVNLKYRSWEGGRCGMHIHISRASMSQSHQMKFLNFIYDSVPLAVAVGQRPLDDPYLMKYAPFDKEHRDKFIMKVRDYINPGVDGHYVAVNAEKSATLESRWFRGTLNPTSFRKNVEFVYAVWQFSKIYGLSTMTEDRFIEWLHKPAQHGCFATLRQFIDYEYLKQPRR